MEDDCFVLLLAFENVQESVAKLWDMFWASFWRNEVVVNNSDDNNDDNDDDDSSNNNVDDDGDDDGDVLNRSSGSEVENEHIVAASLVVGVCISTVPPIRIAEEMPILAEEIDDDENADSFLVRHGNSRAASAVIFCSWGLLSGRCSISATILRRVPCS